MRETQSTKKEKLTVVGPTVGFDALLHKHPPFSPFSKWILNSCWTLAETFEWRLLFLYTFLYGCRFHCHFRCVKHWDDVRIHTNRFVMHIFISTHRSGLKSPYVLWVLWPFQIGGWWTVLNRVQKSTTFLCLCIRLGSFFVSSSHFLPCYSCNISNSSLQHLFRLCCVEHQQSRPKRSGGWIIDIITSPKGNHLSSADCFGSRSAVGEARRTNNSRLLAWPEGTKE